MAGMLGGKGGAAEADGASPAAPPEPPAPPAHAPPPAELFVPGDVVLLLRRGGADEDGVHTVCVDGTYAGLRRFELSSRCLEDHLLDSYIAALDRAVAVEQDR